MTQEHIHKYKQVTLSERTGLRVFKCQLCPRYLKRDLVIGEQCECWTCRNTFRLTKENTTLVKPRCDECRGKVLVVDKQEDKLDKFMRDMGI